MSEGSPRTPKEKWCHMAVQVRIPTILRPFTNGAKVVSSEGSTLADVIAHLDTNHPGIANRLVDESGLLKFINVYLNDEDVRYFDGLSTAVSNNDSITIIPAVAGG
jgi:molybdopterin converting factor small subunit